MRTILAQAVELEIALGHMTRNDTTYRLRLARAHLLSAIDALAELERDPRYNPTPTSQSGVYPILDADPFSSRAREVAMAFK
jgi:hypothetical protein